MAEPFYDPEVKAMIEAGPRLGSVTAETFERVRETRAELFRQVELSDDVTRTDVPVPGPDDNPEVRLRVSAPAQVNGDGEDGSGDSELRPGLFWVHGGGYVIGVPEQDDLRFDRWCQRFDLVGACPQYRLAPEHPYPAGLEDCYAALAWMKRHGPEIGVDPDRVGIGGPSAGGGLAAALALLVRDRGEFEIDYQILIYPMIDDTRVSVTANLDVPVWDVPSNHFGWSAYLGDRFETDDVPYHAAPARCEDLTRLPPTFISVGTLDAFCDEDIDYAKRLNHAGVDVELHVYAGAPHGFEGFAPGSRLAAQARHDLNGWLGRRLGLES